MLVLYDINNWKIKVLPDLKFRVFHVASLRKRGEKPDYDSRAALS